MNIPADKITSYTTEEYTVDAQIWKADADEASMMAPLLYPMAYIKKVGTEYKVTAYFQNCDIMGTAMTASSYGDVEYDKYGQRVPADSDSYNARTQIKTVEFTTDTLENGITFKMDIAMADTRLVFDLDTKVDVTEAPVFPEVEITTEDFGFDWILATGGTASDYANDLTVLPSGDIIMVGQSYSEDGDFADRKGRFEFDEDMFEGKGESSATITRISQQGKVISNFYLEGEYWDSNSYASNVVTTADGGYIVGGAYHENKLGLLDSTYPTGDFASLKTEDGVYGYQNIYIAKYDENDNQLWMVGESGSYYDQVKEIKETPDGGAIILIETCSVDGYMEGLNYSTLYDVVVIKYDAEGNQEFKTVIGDVSYKRSFN